MHTIILSSVPLPWRKSPTEQILLHSTNLFTLKYYFIIILNNSTFKEQYYCQIQF